MITTISITTMITTITAWHGLKHYHDEDMQSVSLIDRRRCRSGKIHALAQDYAQSEGADRSCAAKGILAFKDEPKRFVFQGVHMILDGDLQREWKPQEKRLSRLVFIGRNLKKGRDYPGLLGLRGVTLKRCRDVHRAKE